MGGLRRRLVFLVVLTVAVLAATGVAHAHGDDGWQHGQDDSHGSVKVDDDDIDGQPPTHPHVLCGMRVDVEHGFGGPLQLLFDAEAPTMRGGDDQRLLIVDIPDGDNISGIVDLSGLVGGIRPDPDHGFHIGMILHLPDGGEEHEEVWALPCPHGSTTSTTSTTVKKGGTTTTTAKGATTTTAVSSATTTSTVATGPFTNNSSTGVPTQVLGENFIRPAASTTAAGGLANTGSPFSPALAVGLVIGGLILAGGRRAAFARRKP